MGGRVAVGGRCRGPPTRTRLPSMGVASTLKTTLANYAQFMRCVYDPRKFCEVQEVCVPPSQIICTQEVYTSGPQLVLPHPFALFDLQFPLAGHQIEHHPGLGRV